MACPAGAPSCGAPERGSSPDGNKGTCRSGDRFPIGTTWNKSPLEAHQPPIVEICPLLPLALIHLLHPQRGSNENPQA